MYFENVLKSTNNFSCLYPKNSKYSFKSFSMDSFYLSVDYLVRVLILELSFAKMQYYCYLCLQHLLCNQEVLV